ncbi:MAG: pyridoxamine 5'-phosphate oxidase family protein [Beijerinckiaceae bacterium]
MTHPQHSFYNDLDETLAESWRLVARGVADRKSGFHHMTIASIGLDGRPRPRTVILRGCDVAARALRFHTDIRSEKVQEIAAAPRVGLHFYDPGAKIQLRMDGTATVHTDDAVADAAWLATRTFSRQCYGIAPGPGTTIDAGEDFFLPPTTEEATAPARANFAATVIRIHSMEWLYLASSGHRRAHFDWSSGTLAARWLAP